LSSPAGCTFDATKQLRLSNPTLQAIVSSLLHIVKHSSDQKLADFIAMIRADRPMEEVVDAFQQNAQALCRDGYLDTKKLVSAELTLLAFRRLHSPQVSRYQSLVAGPTSYLPSNQDKITGYVGGLIRIDEAIKNTDFDVDGTFIAPGQDNSHLPPLPHSMQTIENGTVPFVEQPNSLWDDTGFNDYHAAWIPAISLGICPMELRLDAHP
jgi:hypothetical protein